MTDDGRMTMDEDEDDEGDGDDSMTEPLEPKFASSMGFSHTRRS